MLPKSSKYKGVSYDKTRRIKKWKVVIKVNGKPKHFGYHRTEEEANETYLKALEDIKQGKYSEDRTASNGLSVNTEG